MPADLPPDGRSARIRADLLQARDNLLRGRGPGASEAEVAAHTRNRVDIAGISATRRLELAARQTALARGDADAITDAIQLGRAELADTVTQLTARLRPGRLGRDAAASLRAHLRAHPAPYVLGGAAVVLVVRGRRRSARR